MTLEEANALLFKIALFDNREHSALHVAAWQEVLADYSAEDMDAALLRFRQERPNDWLMPGHLIEISKEVTIDKIRDLSRYGLDDNWDIPA